MIAIASVILYHAGVSTVFSARHGVAGFFVLSGFLITWLLLHEFEKHDKISLKNFYARRTLRIFPAYYCFVFVTLAWELYRQNDAIEPLLAPTLFYYVNYYNAIEGHQSISVAHLWSLAIEEQFYLLWPVLFLFLIKMKRTLIYTTLLGIIMAVAVWRSVAYSYLDFGASYAYNAFDTRADNLLIGCLLAFLIRNATWKNTFQSLTSKPIYILFILFLLYLSQNVSSNHYRYGPGFTIDAVLLAILLVQLIRASQSKWLHFLEHPISIYLGKISYPLYLWHIWGLQAGAKIFNNNQFFSVSSGIIISIILASLSYHIVEKTFLKLKKRFQTDHTNPSTGELQSTAAPGR